MGKRRSRTAMQIYQSLSHWQRILKQTGSISLRRRMQDRTACRKGEWCWKSALLQVICWLHLSQLNSMSFLEGISVSTIIVINYKEKKSIFRNGENLADTTLNGDWSKLTVPQMVQSMSQKGTFASSLL